MKREDGYYWIKVKKSEYYETDHWEIDKWYLPEHQDTYQWSLYWDDDVLEIDERRITRSIELSGNVDLKGEDLRDKLFGLL